MEKKDSLEDNVFSFNSENIEEEFKIKEKANSGIKYFVNESLKASPGHGLGLEYAILDNENWPYDKPDYNRTCGSLYDLIRAPVNARNKPMGEWNEARILVNGNHIEHWLNGVMILSYDRGSEDFRKLVAISKYRDITGFGMVKEGRILLQDHGDDVSYKNIKIRKID